MFKIHQAPSEFSPASNNSTGFPDGSSTSTCLPPGPLMGLLRKRAPVASSRVIVSSRLATSITSRFQPPGCGSEPSFNFLAAEVPGPLSHSESPLRLTMANGGPQRSVSRKPSDR